MRFVGMHRATLILCLLALSVGCGGGGAGGIVPPAGPQLLATLKAVLLGSLETVVVDDDAQGAIFVDLQDDGALSFACTAQVDWVSDITMAHIHRGGTGVNGPIEVDLLGNGATFDGGTLTASDTLMIDPALASEIATTPGDFYVNVHTGLGPAGHVRQQLSPLVPIEIHALLLGSQEVPIVDASARGAATFTIGADKAVSYRIGMMSPALATINNAHIHVGAEGVNGGILVDLEPTSATTNATTGLLEGSGAPTLEQLARICNDFSSFYVNVHTSLYPAGVARGQLSQDPVEFWGPLSGSEEVAPPIPVDPNATGGVSVQFDSFTTGRAHLAVPPAQGIQAVTGAHIHRGAAGVNGPIVVDLQAGGDYVSNVDSFSAEGSVTCDQDLLTQMLTDPSNFYVNFHTAALPAGAVRGQVTQSPFTLFAAMNGANEVPPGSALDNGTMTLVLRGIFECSFTIEMAPPPSVLPGLLTDAHVHDDDPLAPDPVVIDALGGTNINAFGNFITGDAVFTGRTTARMLGVPGRFYANVHTAPGEGGVARGSFQLLDGTAPPAGLSYADPSPTYTEGVLITQNLPTSVGGPVSNYAVDPPLPAGLSLDPVTGIMSGTPTVVTPAADHTVTASNAGGSTMATVNVQVIAAAPTNLQYSSPVTYTVGTAIPTNSPTNDGGAITSYSVSPALPAGLSLNTATGDITGTPTLAVGANNHTVTGTNAAGNTMFAVNITVNASLQPPSALSYTTPVVYTTGTAITPNTPTISGGAVASWSITPALAAGLAFSTSTGVISGTPTAIAGAQNHTVTATNAAGFTSAVVNVTVNLGAPVNLTYTNTPNIGYVNTAIANMNPSSQGGTVASYSISPALPAGLTFSTTTGVVSGTPTVTSGQTTYTVTATNAAGMTVAMIIITVY